MEILDPLELRNEAILPPVPFQDPVWAGCGKEPPNLEWVPSPGSTPGLPPAPDASPGQPNLLASTHALQLPLALDIPPSRRQPYSETSAPNKRTSKHPTITHHQLIFPSFLWCLPPFPLGV